MKNKKLLTLLSVLCILLAVFSLWKLTDYIVQNARTRRLNAENAALLAAATETAGPAADTATPSPAEATPAPAKETDVPAEETAVPTEETAEPLPEPAATLKTYYSVLSASGRPIILSDIYELHSRYPDTVGYLKIPCIPRIDFAVVQRDNTYYLNHDISGRKNVTGAAFLDEGCSIWPRSRILVIYAHNMKSGEMFGELHRMANLGLLSKNPWVYFSTLYEADYYAPLFIGTCSIDEVPFWRNSFEDEEDFNGFIGQLREYSEVRLGTEAIFGDDLLTLVTCVDGRDDHRFVAVLRKVREGENTEALKRTVFPDK